MYNGHYVNQKAIISGKIVEFYKYEIGYKVGEQKKSSSERKGQDSTSKETKQENRNKTASRARQRIRRLANANPALTKFVTLTFAENIKDNQTANKLFKDFILRLRYYCRKNKQSNLKYICVVEYQKRGAIHYHMLCNLPYIKKSELADIWKHGFVKINYIDNVDNVGAYICKYMQKNNTDERLIGNRAYFTSQNLTQPEEITNPEKVEELCYRVLNECGEQRRYAASFENDYLGRIDYLQVVLSEPCASRGAGETSPVQLATR